jgi:hypothetical protein
MVPVKVVDHEQPDWKASGWLGIITAGCLWTPLASDIERAADDIVAQIKVVVPKETISRWESADYDSGPASNITTDRPQAVSKQDVQEETVAELARLKAELDAVHRGKLASAGMPMFEAGQPAAIPAPVPQLPRDFRETPAIVELRRMLTTDSADGGPRRIGYWGRGGVGKTITSAALMRDDAVRAYYDQVLFLPLGQTPVMDKIKGMAYLQLTGIEMKTDWSEGQQERALRQAMEGKTLLLYIDGACVFLSL